MPDMETWKDISVDGETVNILGYGYDYFPIYITNTGFDTEYELISWTYSGEETFLGLSLTSGASTPDYVIGDTVDVTNIGALYSVAASGNDSSLVTIRYNGTAIYSATVTGNFKLKTAGKVCQYDIIIELTTSGEESPAAELIVFTVTGGQSVQFSAEAGMTWAEWIASEYCTDSGFSISESTVYLAGLPLIYNGNRVNSSDVIVDDATYYRGGGGSD